MFPNSAIKLGPSVGENVVAGLFAVVLGLL
jgi:hypothetical protein